MSKMITLEITEQSNDSKVAEFNDEATPHLNELYAKALQYTKDEDDAEDLVQETFVKAYDNWDRFESGTNCRAWLFTILRNTFINRFRSEKREREILNSDDTKAVREFFFGKEETDYYESPEEETMNKVFSQELRQSLEGLPQEFRKAIILADLNDFSYKEVAYILDCPVGTIMSRLFRGRKLMRQELVGTALELGIIRDEEPYLQDETNRIRQSSKNKTA